MITLRSKSFSLVLSAFSLVLGLAIFGLPQLTWAQQTNTAPSTSNYVPSGKVEDSKGGIVQCGNKANDPCTVEDVFNVFIIATNLLIGVVGLVTIFAVFQAGWVMVTSSGKTEAVSAGKKQLSNALIGMVFVFIAAIMVNIVIYYLAGAKAGPDIFSPLQYIGIGRTSSNSQSNTPTNNSPTKPPTNGP